MARTDKDLEDFFKDQAKPDGSMRVSTLGTFRLKELNPGPRNKATIFEALMVKAPVVVAGYGGWNKVARPRRKSLTEWVGRDPLSIRIEFLFDRLVSELSGREIETACRALEALAGVESTDPEPALCSLSSNPAPLMPHGYHRAPHVKWFIEAGPEWDADSIVYNQEGNRISARAGLTMTQYVEDTRLTNLTSSQRRSKRKSGDAKGSKRKTYTVKKGDTLSKIAARKDVYGDGSKWRKIAVANKIRDPKAIKLGRELKIP